ncbi:MAG: glycerol kinase GlpK [Thaumarchaeota archaeon]|nr:glycerol kinase GlpK [Nitrososphaerota archaeon]
MGNLILSLDQGTTNSKAILFDENGDLASSYSRPMELSYPKAGWVEQTPQKIWETQLLTARKALTQAKRYNGKIVVLAITNQRETTLLWDKQTLEPVSSAIVWQDRRSAGICEELRKAGYSDLVRQKTGLVIDPYFSATKIRWLLDSSPKLRKRAERGELQFGTVDTYLVSRLTKGSLHVTDHTNASRTMLFDTKKLRWDDELLTLFKIPPDILPEVNPSSGIIGEADEKFFGRKIPIAALVGDQQASLFGHAAFRKGMTKNTYGTGCFLLSNTIERVAPPEGLLSTIAWSFGKNDTTYALEGSILSAGAVIQWLVEGPHILQKFGEFSEIARKVQENEGVYFVPALTGLGSPHWDSEARGLIIGITRGTTKEHLVRAALEGICYQTKDVFGIMEDSINSKIRTLRVDGGLSASTFLMQFQANILGVPVETAGIRESTAFGAACLAGLAIGQWKNLRELEKLWKVDRKFVPRMSPKKRTELYDRWKEAVHRSLKWAKY